MKTISLTKNKVAIVDDNMFDELSKYQWQYSDMGYAVCRKYTPSGNITIRMHRVVADTPEGMETDHINGNPLDNRRDNLRVVTHQQNMCNMKLRSDNRFGEKNIGWHSQSGKYRVRFKRHGKELCCKLFRELDDAISFRNEARIRYGI